MKIIPWRIFFVDTLIGPIAQLSARHKVKKLRMDCNYMTQASFVSTGSIPIGMDKYNKKIMIITVRDPDLFRVEN
jgi:hypothetical protein